MPFVFKQTTNGCAEACQLAQAKLNAGYTRISILTWKSSRAQRKTALKRGEQVKLAEGEVQVRWWDKSQGEGGHS